MARARVVLLLVAALAPIASFGQDNASPPLLVMAPQKQGTTVYRLENASSDIRGPVEIKSNGGSGTGPVLVGADAVVVIQPGQADETLRFGMHPTARTQATVLDAATTAVRAVVELGWGVGPAAFSPDGQLLALTFPGYRSNKPAETLPAELFVLDTAAGKTTERLTLERPAGNLVILDAATAVAVLKPSDEDKPGTSLLKFVDMTSGQLAGSLSLDGRVRTQHLSAADGLLYVWAELRAPDNKAAQHRLYVVSSAQKTLVATFEIGDVRAMLYDLPGRAVLGVATKTDAKQSGGEVVLLRGAELEARIPLRYAPGLLRVAPDGKEILAVGQDAITRIALDTLKPTGEIAMHKGAPREIFNSPDGSRVFVLYSDNDRVAIVDLQAQKMIAAVKTGSGATKFGQAMAQAQMANLDGRMASAGPLERAILQPSYRVERNMLSQRVAQARGTEIEVRPDGERIYVLNRQTNDVTVIDVKAGKDVVKVGVGQGCRLLRLFGTRLYAFSHAAVRVIDTSTNTEVKDQGLKDVGHVLDYDDGARAVGFTNEEVVWLSFEGGETQTRRAALPPDLRGRFQVNVAQAPQVVILSAR